MSTNLINKCISLVNIFEIKLVTAVKIFEEESKERTKKKIDEVSTFKNVLDSSKPLSGPIPLLENAKKRLLELLMNYEFKNKNSAFEENIFEMVEGMSRVKKSKNLEMKKILITGFLTATKFIGVNLDNDDISSKILKSYLKNKQALFNAKFVFDSIVSNDSSLDNTLFEAIWTDLFKCISPEIFNATNSTTADSPMHDFESKNVDKEVNAILDELKDHDVDEEVGKNMIVAFKKHLKDEMKIMSERYYLLIYEQMTDAVQRIGDVIEKKEKKEDQQKKEPPQGQKNIVFEGNNVKNWHSEMH